MSNPCFEGNGVAKNQVPQPFMAALPGPVEYAGNAMHVNLCLKIEMEK